MTLFTSRSGDYGVGILDGYLMPGTRGYAARLRTAPSTEQAAAEFLQRRMYESLTTAKAERPVAPRAHVWIIRMAPRMARGPPQRRISNPWQEITRGGDDRDDYRVIIWGAGGPAEQVDRVSDEVFRSDVIASRARIEPACFDKAAGELLGLFVDHYRTTGTPAAGLFTEPVAEMAFAGS